ncbi:hypothetical protein [Vibrio mangrovi]|uniref:HEAT repeat protein n=1 Tax=Vibrio mangrovi TaxID=474394 RepID=A0A1Y6IY92_9VIBR|nr:hypothetical protein [Vibrio mangrovi]MDW6002120.1 hypothetical protein [Vibrio mangrovi]SMS01462.1 hypothetical protein VIM7927_02758 [Vibrio mangrovi]
MPQGTWVSRLLLLFFCFSCFPVFAKSLDVMSRDQLLQAPSIQSKVAELKQFITDDKIDSLKFALQRLALPQQEAVRFLLLRTLEQEKTIFSAPVEHFIEQQRLLPPVYYVTEKGDGYELSTPAFNYPAVASRLVKSWKQEKSILDFVLQVEHHHLRLRQWLSGDKHQHDARESLLIKELGSLSESGLRYLTEQIVKESISSWLPSTRVMAALAKESRSEDIYRLLWLMKSDYYSEAELTRLSALKDDFSLQQVMAASHNPSLRDQAINTLVQTRPMSEKVKTYLVQQLSQEEAPYVAQTLVEAGYRSWLEELLKTDRQVKHGALVQALGR